MNKKSLLLFAAAPLLLAGCGKISSIPSFKKYDEASAVTKEVFFADLEAKQEEFLGRMSEEKAKGASFIGEMKGKSADLQGAETLVGKKVEDSTEYTMEQSVSFDGKNNVAKCYDFVESNEALATDHETDYYKDFSNETYQMGTVEQQETVIYAVEETKLYNACKDDSVQGVAFEKVLMMLGMCSVDYVIDDKLTKFYEKDGLFTIVLKKTISDAEGLNPEDNVTKMDTTIEAQWCFDGNKMVYGMYSLYDNESGKNSFSKKAYEKTEMGVYCEIEIKSVTNKALDLSKYQFSKDLD